jgi:glycine cleavage system H protein
MPEIDGMEVLRIVKKNHPEIVVIMITGYPSVESAVKAMRLGVSNYVPKPLDPDGLTNTLQKALDERKTGRKDLFYYQKYIWARMLENGTVEVGVNEKLRQDKGDILYVDLPCHETRAENGRLLIRVLAADKQMHKLCVPIRSRVVGVNYQINFNTDLINKDPFGKGWIVRLEPFNLEEDLKNWSGNISFFSDQGKAKTNSPNAANVSDAEPITENETETAEKPQAESPVEPKREPRSSRPSVAKFMLSALASRLFFVSLLPTCLGAVVKGLFTQVSPQSAS